jgi:glycine/D-amino acid oxidase-like deaminating enzyme
MQPLATDRKLNENLLRMTNPSQSPPNASPPVSGEVLPAQSSGMVGNLISVVGLLITGVYLANPTAGFIEFLPDALPGIGNFDEVVATTIFLACLSRLGINLVPGRATPRSERKE